LFLIAAVRLRTAFWLIFGGTIIGSVTEAGCSE
jgi:hypothetical protein